MRAKPIVSKLNALKDKVSLFEAQYPRSSSIGGAGVARAEKQIPWICQTLDQAAEALRSGRDPFGNPITPGQVISGLKQLTAYVRDSSYGTLMEMVYPGIDKPLQESMDDLEKVIQMLELD
jgi:hypothetical protein